MPGGQVRPFEQEDIPQVVALRQRAFSRTAQPTPEAAEAYFELSYFDHPFRDMGLPSLVYEDRSGRLAGFLGILPRPVLYRGEPVRVAVSTQFMVEPGERGGAGIRLLKHFMDGPQDLSYTDGANDASRGVWEGLGGKTAAAHSLAWVRTLRPARYAASRLGDHPAVRAARLVTRPLLAAADVTIRATARGARRLERPDGLRTTQLEARDIADLLPAMAARYALVPAYTEAALRWLLDRLAKRGSYAVQARLVRSADDQPVGWYVYFRRGVLAEVVQIAARPGRWADVFTLLAVEARDDGSAALTGRLDPAQLHDLAALGCWFTRGGPWTLVHSKHPELTSAVLAGEAFFSRLDGEWLMNF
jgi:hypothetical protein